MNLRELARDKPCQIRLPDICNGDPATTVLAHFRMAGLCGIAQKVFDIIAAWACSACHDACDRRTHTELDRDYVRLAHLEGVVRTLYQLVKLGRIKV